MVDESGGEEGYGRRSMRPGEIPLAGWRDVLARTWVSMFKDNISLVAAGMAFYGLLAIFPALAALVSIYGLFADPQQVQQHLQMTSGVVPEQARTIIGDQMAKIAASQPGALGVAGALSLLLAVWGATKGVKGFMAAMNIAYGEEEKRGIIAQNVIAIALTVFMVFLALLALATVAVVPFVIDHLFAGPMTKLLIAVLRWPALALIFFVALAVLYRYTPSRADARWSWVSPGSLVAIVLWLLASVAFSIYLRNFGSYNEVYGSLGAIIAMMMWLWLSAFIAIFGAELNAEAERQTRYDSTTGWPKPLGQRGAYAADTVGEGRQRTK